MSDIKLCFTDEGLNSNAAWFGTWQTLAAYSDGGLDINPQKQPKTSFPLYMDFKDRAIGVGAEGAAAAGPKFDAPTKKNKKKRRQAQCRLRIGWKYS